MAETVLNERVGSDATNPGFTSFEMYLEGYAHDYYELVEGQVVKMSPIGALHDAIAFYLRLLLTAYFELRPIGVVRSGPFVMKLAAINVSREPDLQVILKNNPGQLTESFMDGPADICIEV